MRVKNFIIVSLLGLLSVPAMAQNIEEERTDSLQQVVDEISEKNKQLEAEALDKKIWKTGQSILISLTLNKACRRQM